MPVRRLLVLLAIWSVVAVAIVLFWGGVVQTPGCASHVEPSLECFDLINAMNDHIWWSHTVPVLAAVLSGYALILGYGLLLRRKGQATSR